jgi:hypothetical protein
MIWLVEFFQNFPLVCAFIYGYANFITGKPAAAFVWIVAGVTAGALIIRYTEAYITQAPVERPAETLTNIGFFGLAILGFNSYFIWKVGSWMLDLALAFAAGSAVSLLQARAAAERLSTRHLSAMVLSFAAALLLIRFWALGAAPAAAALLLTAVATVIIVLVEYLDQESI